MKPVDQTTFGVPKGNCFSACVASLLEMSIEDVPFFMGDGWPDNFGEWLKEIGYYYIFVPIKRDQDDWRPQGLHILGGQSSRGPHVVVAKGFDVVHDPHPSREGLSAVEEVFVIVPTDPARARRVG